MILLSRDMGGTPMLLMGIRSQQREEAELRRLSAFKGTRQKGPAPLGEELLAFYKQSVQKREPKLAKIAEVWLKLVPETISVHCALEGFSRGSLSVNVSSSAQLYELKQLLLSGLEQQLLLACKGAGLRKVTLKVGPTELG